ncbi:hypothetical protein [Mycobacteroides abscessus]|uniref:hypothetical protein n=1 Tax=Mycobacteroides abscessus TaxID=36809 RepID=UPI0019277360|nr:hypothetical protein [Mycobacteroides abscessus]MBL3752926.1 hypothetical protein [Mycobacteroides abscessus subsp. massiliense]
MIDKMTIALGIALMLVGALNLQAGLSGRALSLRGGVLGGVLAMCIGAINIVFGVRGQGLPGAWLSVMGVLLACQLWVVASDVRKSKRTNGLRG